ncbi:MAG: phenylacetate--CoA ligase family protein [Reyranellaceae bacterium]
MHFSSDVPSHYFPGIPEPRAARMFAVASQLEWSSRMPAAQFNTLQYRQLHALFVHAERRSRFWRERLRAAGFDPAAKTFDIATLSRLPPLTRQDMQTAYEEMRAYPAPAKWGDVSIFQTSGSTGQWVRVEKPEINTILFDAVTFVDHMWHRRDFTGKLAVIRKEVGKGAGGPFWSRETVNLVETGPRVEFNPVGKDMTEVLAWLEKERPDYVTTWPSIARQLAYLKIQNGGAPLRIRQFLTFGEMVTPEIHEVLGKAFGATVADRYSTEEAGYIALQCGHGNYHAVPLAIVEIVDDQYRPVPPGTIGRVLITLPHSFVMPLIRYEVGDYAIAGTKCGCGRTWPIIEKIMGRERSIVQFPDGSRQFVPIDGLDWTEIGPIRQWQFRQVAADRIDLLVTPSRPLTEAERSRLDAEATRLFRNEFRIDLQEVAAIESLPSGKRPEFVRAF